MTLHYSDMTQVRCTVSLQSWELPGCNQKLVSIHRGKGKTKLKSQATLDW